MHLFGGRRVGLGGEEDAEKAHSAFLGLLADVVHTCAEVARTETPRWNLGTCLGGCGREPSS